MSAQSISSIAVFCASSTKVAAHYKETARLLGRILAQRQIRLIDGAGAVGLMGALNDACLAAGGQVTGVIPQFMVDRGWCHTGLTHLEVTPSMHARKERIFALSDGLIALPGGVGTLEELLEAITWKQLGLLPKPIVILNAHDYYAPLLAMLERAVAEQFMRPIHRTLWQVAASPEEAVAAVLNAPVWDNSIERLAQV